MKLNSCMLPWWNTAAHVLPQRGACVVQVHSVLVITAGALHPTSLDTTTTPTSLHLCNNEKDEGGKKEKKKYGKS